LSPPSACWSRCSRSRAHDSPARWRAVWSALSPRSHRRHALLAQEESAPPGSAYSTRVALLDRPAGIAPGRRVIALLPYAAIAAATLALRLTGSARARPIRRR
jgi:hypothetical protein